MMYRRLTRNTFPNLLAILAALASQTAFSAPLTFSQCVDIALRQNPDVADSADQVQAAKAGLKQANGYQMPKLTASLIGTETNDALNAFGLKLAQRGATFNDFGAGQFTGPSALSVAPNNLNYPGVVHNFDTRVELDIPVYTGGMIDGGIKQAREYIAAAENGDKAARQQVIFDLLQAWEGVSAARAYLDVANQAEAASRSMLTMMQNMSKGGTVVKSDLLLAQVRLQDVLVQKTQAENAVAGALDQLHVLMGVPLDQPLEVGDEVNVTPVTTPLIDLQREAQENNPGIMALRHQAAASSASIDMARSANLPQVGLMVRQDWNDPNLGFSSNSWTVGGNVSWTAFDGGITRGKIDQAEASHNQALARLARAEAGVAMQVADARRKATEAEQRLTEREMAVSQVEEATRLVNKRYAAGVATITEQLGAQAELDKARADVVAARYDLAVQRARLKLATGQLEPDSL